MHGGHDYEGRRHTGELLGDRGGAFLLEAGRRQHPGGKRPGRKLDRRLRLDPRPDRLAQRYFQWRPKPGHHFYFQDYLHSTSIVTDCCGNIFNESDYYPYGGERIITDSDANRYKFTGKERDTESGLDNFGKRYFGSSLGRFMTPDLLHIMKQKLIDPQQWNMYAYVRNNPLRFTDPTGMYTCADQADCKSKQDKAFETARQNDLKSKDPAVVAAAKAYGDPTKANGVGVAFAKSLPEGCNGSACTQASLSFADGKALFSQNVTFKTGLSATELNAAVGHEGVHVEDA
jgi:RHS repeat-associated protein